MIRFLITTAHSRGGAYFDLGVTGEVFIKGRCLFETWRLLEEIRYADNQ